MAYITTIIYCFISTGFYFSALYREDISIFMSVAVPFVLFAPILFSITKSRPSLLVLNMVAVISFAVGVALGSNSNIWPIALGIWLGLSIPAIFVLNATALIYIKTHNNSSNLTGANNAPPS